MKESCVTATVLISGGIDSAACAHHLISQGFTVEGLFIDYGQGAALREAEAVSALSRHLRIVTRRANLQCGEAFGTGELIARNSFLVFTALFLTRGRSNLLALGVHDGTPYYDCSEAFVAAAGKLVTEQTDGRVSIVAPFVTWTKKDVYDYFVSAGLPVRLTYSCEAGTEPVCGTCHSCLDRKALGC